MTLEDAIRLKRDFEPFIGPYQMTLHIMPLNFPDFWVLIGSIEKYKQKD